MTRPRDGNRRGPTIATAAAVLAGVALRWSRLSAHGLWFDEGYTAWVVTLPARQLVRAVSADTAPPLYYLLLRAWAAVVGHSEAALRSLSAAAAAAGLIGFVFVARRLLTDPWARAGAVALFAGSYLQVAYAHECRFYAAMSAMGVLDLLLVLRACEKASVARLAAVAAAWTVSLYLNNVMAVYLAALGLAWLILPGSRPTARRLLDVTIVTATAAVAFAPWVPTMAAQTRAVRAHYWTSPPDGPAFARAVAGVAGVNDQGVGPFDAHGLTGAAVLLALCATAGVAHRPARRASLAMLIYAGCPIVALFAYSRVGQSIFLDRAFLASGVGFAVLATVPIDLAMAHRRPRWAGGWAVVVAVAATMSLPGRWLGEHPEAWREACAFAVATPARHRAVVAVANEGQLLWDYYAAGRFGPSPAVAAAPADFYAPVPPRTMRQVAADADLAGVRHLLDRGGFDELVLLWSHEAWADRDGRTLKLLMSRLRLRDRQTFTPRAGATPVTVYRFTPRPLPGEPA